MRSLIMICIALAIIVGVIIAPVEVASIEEIKLAPIEQADPRFTITAVQTAYDNNGSSNNRKTLYIIRDKTTGVEYIGINGLGITQLKQVGKTLVSEEE